MIVLFWSIVAMFSLGLSGAFAENIGACEADGLIGYLGLANIYAPVQVRVEASIGSTYKCSLTVAGAPCFESVQKKLRNFEKFHSEENIARPKDYYGALSSAGSPISLSYKVNGGSFSSIRVGGKEIQRDSSGLREFIRSAEAICELGALPDEKFEAEVFKIIKKQELLKKAALEEFHRCLESARNSAPQGHSINIDAFARCGTLPGAQIR
jgi:hypothetical protein